MATDEEILNFLTKGKGVPKESESSVASSAPQYTGAKRAVMLPVQAVNDTIPALLGLPGNAEFLLKNYVYNPLTGSQHVQYLPTSRDVKKLTDKLGFTGNPRLDPEKAEEVGSNPLTEKLVSSAITGAVGAVPTMGLGVSLPNALVSGALGGTAGEAAHQIDPESILFPAAASLLGGATGGGIVGAVERAGTNKAIIRSADEAAKNLKAAKELVAEGKVKNPEQIQLFEKSRLAQQNANIANITNDANQIVKDSDSIVWNLANKYGKTATPQAAGEYAQNRFREWLNDDKTGLPGKMNAAKAPVKTLVPDDLPGNVTNLQEYVNGIVKSGGSLDELNAILRPHIPDRFANILNKESQGRAEFPARYSKQITYKDLDTLRDSIGNARGVPSLVSSTGDEQLNGMYRAVAQDQRDAVAKMGNPDALKALDDWNTEANRLFNIKEKIGPKLVAGKNSSPNDPDISKIVDSLTAPDLALLRQEIPDVVDQIAASHLRQPEWGNIKSPEYLENLIPDPSHRAAFNIALTGKNTAEDNAKNLIAAEKSAATSEINDIKTQMANWNRWNDYQVKVRQNESKDLGNQVKGISESEHQNLMKYIRPEVTGPALGGLASYLGILPSNMTELQAISMGILGGALSRSLASSASRKATIQGGLAGEIGAQANPLLPPVEFTWGPPPEQQ